MAWQEVFVCAIEHNKKSVTRVQPKTLAQSLYDVTVGKFSSVVGSTNTNKFETPNIVERKVYENGNEANIDTNRYSEEPIDPVPLLELPSDKTPTEVLAHQPPVVSRITLRGRKPPIFSVPNKICEVTQTEESG